MFDSFKKLFTPVESLDADQAEQYIQQHEAGDFTLLDVRQPSEYEQEHIPGSTLVPLPQLAEAYDKLDPDKPVIVY
jgi:sulfur-carrier protein adenylyltransferase/sulfurtransferase